MQHGVLHFAVQDQAGRVRLGVAADDQNFLTHLGQSGQGVLGGRRFADAALAIECDLTRHGFYPFGRGAVEVVGETHVPPHRDYRNHRANLLGSPAKV